ncbi:MAG: protein-disulfide reductase DsbD domain-containing protein [Candidatus Acidiferrales bacterium]
MRYPFIGRRIPAIVALAASIGAAARAQDNPGPRLVISLISADKRFEAGKDAWLGLHFQIEKGWHIYWQNPGDSGEPPRVEWKLTKGIAIGAIEWPYPQRLEHSSIADYGYENDAVLPIKINIAANAAAGPARIDATVKWLVCSDICIPGKSNLYIVRDVTTDPPAEDTAAAQMIRAARARVPRPLPASWRASAELAKSEFTLHFQTGEKIASAQFFPTEAGIIENAASQEFTLAKQGFMLRLERTHELLKPVARLKGVVVLGSGSAYAVSLPFTTK